MRSILALGNSKSDEKDASSSLAMKDGSSLSRSSSISNRFPSERMSSDDELISALPKLAGGSMKRGDESAQSGVLIRCSNEGDAKGGRMGGVVGLYEAFGTRSTGVEITIDGESRFVGVLDPLVDVGE